MSYAAVEDVQSGMLKEMSEREQEICEVLLERAGRLIDAYNAEADEDIKKDVSCGMVSRAIGADDISGVPMGATQGSMSALGYSQSWTFSNGTVGELYLSKQEKKLLGLGNRIGSYSPVEGLVYDTGNNNTAGQSG
ncbi:MAG: hypothetical protein IJT16_02085 [Lachnospiraceae bacterium]|nr:hypothetical protein [Lachnospiraceae bacterium]